jgi:hypothetical protein
MKRLLLGCITLIGSTVAFAQPPEPAAAAAQPRTITLTGCVAGGQNAQPVTLANALVIPATEQPAAAAAPPSPVPDAVSPTPTQPQSAGAGAAAGAGPAGAAAPPATSETAGATAPAAVGTTGTVAGTAPAGSSSSSASGYRLSGADMSTWIGKRVQIVGSLVPAAAGAAVTAAASSAIGASAAGASGSSALPEFRVVSVSPATGDCPKP